MKFEYNDGGRKAAGFKGKAGDCATRAVAIATNIPYTIVYDRLNVLSQSERVGKRKRGKSNSRTGVYKDTFKKLLKELGWIWVPTMGIGTGCKVHMREDELPKGNIIVNLSRHYAAVINGVLNDTYDCSREGNRCVYGYWYKA